MAAGILLFEGGGIAVVGDVVVVGSTISIAILAGESLLLAWEAYGHVRRQRKPVYER